MRMRTPQQEAEVQSRLSRYQSVYDPILEPLRRAAPPPQQGESVNEYRRRSLGFIQQFLPPSSEWKNVSLDGCMSDSLNAIEPQILNAARRVATDPRMLAQTPAARPDTADGTLRMVELNGVRTFHPGEPGANFVKMFTRPGRRVLSFTTDNGRWNAATGGWF
jgi:hypothetical protein